MSAFTHLHTASGFSLRYGASHPQELVVRAAERGMDALALTDRDTLGGAVRFAKAAAGAGVRPIFGTSLAVAEQEPAPVSVSRRRTPVKGGVFLDESAPRVTLLARDGSGWAALCALVTAAHAGGGRPRVGFADLARQAGDERLVVLLGPESEVVRALMAGRPDRAELLLAPWREMFGSGLRLEVVCHGHRGTGPGSVRLAAHTLGFAAEQKIQPVLTNAVRYAVPGQHRLADVLDAARRLVPIDPRGPLDSGERWLKDPAAMAEVAERVVRAAGWGPKVAHRLLEVTEATAASCLVDPYDDLGIGRVHFPEPELVGAGGGSADRILRERCTGELVQRGRDREQAAVVRLEHELGIIERLGYASYFLVVAQVCDDTRALGIRVAARGSGAGSLVNHLLGIAQADPVEHGLIMERFLSESRSALPDIDIDVESARRLEVYRAILDRFGPQRVATVSMPETYRVRHAIRDVGAALSMDPAEVDRLAKAFPHIRARDARAALAELPELAGIDADAYGLLWELVEGLDGLPRGIAMHPCGVLLSDAGLLSRTPVVPTSGEGFPMTQFDKDDVEDLGLLKLDVLGVRMQSALAHAVDEVERVSGVRLDIDSPEQVPPGDPATYQLIKDAASLGCFQIESPGQRDLIARLQPETFHDLVVDISLFRPGPVAANMVKPFIERRHGRQPTRYPHEDLKYALSETHGVVVFHEQVIQIVSTMTGCDASQADEVRRNLSKSDQLEQLAAWFTKAAAAKGYDSDTVERTWEIVAAFGAYGFAKAHAVAFAVPTYQSAWMKTHRAAAFYAGLLTHDPGMYPKRLIVADARRRGVPVLPLDVNASDTVYRVERTIAPDGSPGPYGVRLALMDVHGIHEADAKRIVSGQPYVSVQDLMVRARPARPVAERLAQVGALDAFGDNRRDLSLHIAELHQSLRAAAHGGQLPFDGDTQAAPSAGLPDMDEGERLGAELAVLGVDVSRHLMADHQDFLAELGVIPAKQLGEVGSGRTILVAGAKASTQTPPVASGKRVIFTTLDDLSGLVDLAFFEDSHPACAHTVFHSGLLLVRGQLQHCGRALSVVGSAAWNLAELAEIRRTGGLDAVAERLAVDAARRPTTEANRARGRHLEFANGYAMHPWADLKPAGEGTAAGRKLWHQSPGSAG